MVQLGKQAHKAIKTIEQAGVKCCGEACRCCRNTGGEPTFPTLDRVLGTELAAGPRPWACRWSSLIRGCEAQRAEALPVSGRAKVLAQVCATLNFWVTLAVPGFAGSVVLREPTHRGGASVGPEQSAESKEVSIVSIVRGQGLGQAGEVGWARL